MQTQAIPEFYTKLAAELDSATAEAEEAVKDLPEKEGAFNFDDVYVRIPEGVDYWHVNQDALDPRLSFGIPDSGLEYRNDTVKIVCAERFQQNKRALFVRAVGQVLANRGYQAFVEFRPD